ncbi:MAG: HpnM family protein, partial [Nitrosomonadaceae bacterium]
ILLEIKLIFHLLIMAAMLLYLPASWAQKPDTTSPVQTVNSLHATLLKGMREGDKIGFQGRFKLLAPVLNRTHDLGFIAHTILGKLWTKLDREQQHIFIGTFRKLSISTYAGWFKNYEGERFEFIEKKTMPRNQILVRSRLIKANGDTVSLDYILRQGKEGWHIINILADGVSDLALKRVEYRSILRQKGFPVFIDMLKEKIALAEKN